MQIESDGSMIENDLIVVVNAVTLFLILKTSNSLKHQILRSCDSEFNLITRIIFISTLFLRFQETTRIYVQELNFIAVFDEVSLSQIENLLVL